jgi:DNA-binding transcriptional LysR family regulator
MSTFRQFSYFLAVVDEESFTRAAEKVMVSQPSLSQQIKALEAEIGAELLERGPRGVRLTSAGKQFVPHARAACRSAESAMRTARSAARLEEGEIEISTVRSIAAGILPDLIRSWRQRYPGTSVRLHEFNHRRLSEQSVFDGLSEVGIGPPPIGWAGPVCRLGWEELVIILPDDDPMNREGKIDLRALAGREWVAFDPENGMSEFLSYACANCEPPFKPNHAVFTAQVETAAKLAAAGVGPALVPSNTVPANLRGAVLSCDPPVGRELTLFTRFGWSPIVTAFRELLEETAWAKPPEGAVVIP